MSHSIFNFYLRNVMSEQFLTLMADLDDDTQRIMSKWYDQLKENGFVGKQTLELPYHISLETFSLDKEKEAFGIMQKVALEFSKIEVQIDHIGIFPGGKVLFMAPKIDAKLEALHNACNSGIPQEYPWTPHVTMLIDESNIICNALPLFIKSFTPLAATITRLHLCAFWPTREIGAANLV